MIFHSAILSTALSTAVRTSGLLKALNLDSSFAFVNYVFRLNCFAPGDNKFDVHRDTPLDRTSPSIHSSSTSQEEKGNPMLSE